MFITSDLTPISRVSELDPGTGWIYRFAETFEWLNDLHSPTKWEVQVTRVPKDRQWWTHGVIVQRLDELDMKFLPGNICGPVHKFTTMRDALDFVEAYQEHPLKY